MKRTSTISRGLNAVALVLGLTIVAACSTDPERAKAEYVKSGDRYFAQKQYAEAAVQYRNALQYDPRFGEAYYKLGQTYEQLADRQKARAAYVRAADALPSDTNAQLKAGAYLLLAGRFDDARARAERVIKADPKSVPARILLGNSLAGLKDFDNALSELEQASKLAPGSAALTTSVGALHLAEGRLPDAEEAFRKAVTLNPKQPSAHLALAHFLWGSGRMPEAEKELQAALSIDPHNLLANRGLAMIYVTTDRVTQAEPFFKAMADADTSEGASLKLGLADYYVLVNRHAAALDVLKGLLDKPKARAAAEPRVAVIRYTTESKEAGSKAIDEVLARDQKSVPALLVKTSFLISSGKLDEALKTAQAAAAADPESVQARYLLGSIYRAKRRPDEAREAFTEVLKLNPRATAAQTQLAELSIGAGSPHQALQYANDAAKQVPNNLRVQLTLVRTLVANRELRRAQETAALLVRSAPKVAAVHAAAGTVAMARNDLAAATKAYARALELDPNDREAFNGLVMLDYVQKHPDKARARVDAQLAKTPKDPAVLVLAGRIYATTGDVPKAEEFLQRAIEIDPDNLRAYGLLGQLYIRQNRLPQARQRFEAVAQKQPSSVPMNTIVAILYEMEGNRAEARKRYEHVLQLSPQAAVAANNLAYMYAQDGGNLDVALQLAQTAKQRLPDSPEVSDTLGWIYVKKDLASLAISHLQDAVAKAPNSANTNFHLGVALTMAGQPEKGRQSLERALELNLEVGAADEARKLLAKVRG